MGRLARNEPLHMGPLPVTHSSPLASLDGYRSIPNQLARQRIRELRDKPTFSEWSGGCVRPELVSTKKVDTTILSGLFFLSLALQSFQIRLKRNALKKNIRAKNEIETREETAERDKEKKAREGSRSLLVIHWRIQLNLGGVSGAFL